MKRVLLKEWKADYLPTLAHPDLFMRSYPEFDRHCKLVSRHICRTAVRLNLPLEYNIGYEEYNDIHGITTIPHPDFWKIAAHEVAPLSSV